MRPALGHLGCDADVLALDPYSLDDVLDTFGEVAARAGVPERGVGLQTVLRTRLAELATALASAPRPRVAVVEWVDPPFTAGHWIPDMVRAAWGEPVASTPHERSVPTTWSAVAEARPDIVVVSPCGYHLDGAAEQSALVQRALPGTQVWAIDGDGLVVRPGPRVVDGVEALASILHPDRVPPDPTRVRRVC